MTLDGIPYSEIVPPGISRATSDEIVFLLFNYPKGTTQLLNQITRHIQNMDRHILHQLENKLDLRLRSASQDSHGNVCFANDPQLRPEFRTTFQASDLWDYYYALWHSGIYWSATSSDKNSDLPLPCPDIFWSVVEYGHRLRELHTLKAGDHETQLLRSETRNDIVEPMDDRFEISSSDDQKGKLFLNKELYLSNVPKQTWDFNLSGVNPLKRWIGKNMNQTVTRLQIERLSQMVHAVSDTITIQIALDHLFGVNL